MELQQLRCVIAIADHGTFTEAAKALHVSQPALSYAIGRLEKELGSQLFIRSVAGARVTATGAAFLAPARRALAEVTNGHLAVQAVTGLLTGELTVVGVRTAVIETAHLASDFHRRHPDVKVIIEEPGDDRYVVESVRTRRCDIGLIHSMWETELPGMSVGGGNLVAIFPNELAPTTKAVTTKALADMPLLAPIRGSYSRTRYDELFRELGKTPNVVAECPDHSVVEMVRGGFGAALISDAIAATIQRDGIVICEVRPQLPNQLTAIRMPNASPAAEAFLPDVS